MISMGNGLRTLSVASLNAYSMREATTKREIVKGLTENRIHIAAIQETHITQAMGYILGNYRVITAAPDKSETTGIVSGGSAIMIRESIQQRIT